MPRLSDAQVLALTAELAGYDNNPVRRVLGVVATRLRAGVGPGLTERECTVLIAAAAGDPVPPHPYSEQWDLRIIVARKESTCRFCDTPIPSGTEIGHWPVTMQWGHRACVEAKADAEPPTKERRQKSIAIGMSMYGARRD